MNAFVVGLFLTAGPAPLPWAYPFAAEASSAATFRRDGAPAQTQVLVDPVSMGAEQASMLLLTATGNLEVWPHRHRAAELVYVLEGAARVRAASRQWVEVKAGDAVYLRPMMAHGWLYAGSPTKPTRLLVVYDPPGPERIFRDGAAHAATMPVPAQELKSPDPRAPGPEVMRAAETVEQLNGPGSGGVRTYFGDGQTLTLGVLRGVPGFAVAEHVHPTTAELLYVLRGEGEMTVEGTVQRVRAGTAVHIPIGRKHAFKVQGLAPFEAVRVYAP